MRFSYAVLSALSLGCSALGGGSVASLEAEVRRLRAEQERQAAQLEQLQTRVDHPSDATRTAARTSDVTGARAVVRLGPEAPLQETLRVDVTDRTRPSEQNASGDEPVTLITAARGDRIPERPAFVVHENDRLQVVPLAPFPLAPSPLPSSTPAAVVTPASAAPRPTPTEGRNERVLPPMGTLDPGAVHDYDAALALARGERCEEAITAFTEFLSRYPEHPHADNAVYWRAECILRGGDRHRALAEFESLISRYPGGNKVPDALYKIATIQRRLGMREASDAAAQHLMNDFPDTDAARRMRAERTQSP